MKNVQDKSEMDNERKRSRTVPSRTRLEENQLLTGFVYLEGVYSN